MTSYQKLKQKNQQLEKDIAILVFYSGSIAAHGVAAKYKLQKELHDMGSFGERENYCKEGIVSQISK